MAEKFDQGAYVAQWQKSNQRRINLALSRVSGEAQAVEAASEKFGCTPSQYVRKAVINQLISDGFLLSDYRPGKEVMPESDTESVRHEPMRDFSDMKQLEREDSVYQALLDDQERYSSMAENLPENNEE